MSFILAKMTRVDISFLEEWRSREDLDIHIASDYIQSLFGNIQSLIESSDIVEIKKI